MPLSPQQQPGAGNPNHPATQTATVWVYDHHTNDLALLSLDVVQLLQTGIVPTGIGVVYPNNECGLQLARCLHQQGVPLYLRRNTNLLDQPFIRQLLLLLNYLRAEHHLPGSGDELLFEILHCEWWGIAATDIAHLTIQAGELRYRTGTTLRQYLVGKMQEQPTDLFWQPLPKPLREAMTALESMVAAVPGSTLQQLVEKAVQDGGLLTHARNQADDTLQQMLHTFLGYVARQIERHPHTGIEELMHGLDIMRRQGQEIAYVQTSGNPDGVQLLPASLFAGQAFGHLFWISPLPEPSPFPETAAFVASMPANLLPKELLAAFVPTPPQAPEIAHLDDAYEARAVQAFQMNVSALNNYLRCPLAFFYHNIVRIPSPRNEAMAFGSAVHHALELLFRKAQEAGSFPAEDDLVAAFTDYMQRHRESFTLAEYHRRMAYGHTILRNYYRHYEGTWNTIVVVERNIRGVDLDEIPLKGKLDKIEFNGRQATIVDYKSGNVAYALKQLERPGEQHPNGGDYWRQAVFYKMLVEGLAGKDWQVEGVVFDFIEPDAQGAYRREKVAVTPADEATVKEQIRTVWAKVQRHDFYTGCGKPGCHWCSFVKTNKLAIALHDIVSEEPESGRGFLRVV